MNTITVYTNGRGVQKRQNVHVDDRSVVKISLRA